MIILQKKGEYLLNFKLFKKEDKSNGHSHRGKNKWNWPYKYLTFFPIKSYRSVKQHE